MTHLRVLLAAIAVGLGAVHTWVAIAQQSMNEDGISYLDLGDAYLRGDWSTAINTVWSPLYAVILGTVMRVLGPSMQWEYAVVHITNFIIYLVALISFDFMWREVRESVVAIPESAKDSDGERLSTFPDWAWLAIGYGLFIWASLSLIKVWAVTPDMLMASFVFAGSGLLVRLVSTRGTRSTAAWLGAALGLAYLAKSVMFPLAFVFFLATLYAGGFRRVASRVALSVSCFLVLTLPFVAVISAAKERPTFGDAGRLTYLRHVNGAPYPHWRSGVVEGIGEPAHAARQLSAEPVAFEFATPIAGTYPLGYDPSYWYEGTAPTFHLGRQVRRIAISGSSYVDLFLRQLAGPIAVFVVLVLFRKRTDRDKETNRGPRALVFIAGVALGLYSTVLVSPRYVAPFIVLIWAGLLPQIHLAESERSRRLLAVGGAIIAAFLFLNVALFNLAGVSRVAGLGRALEGIPAQQGPSTGRPVAIAEQLAQRNVGEGDRIAFIGYAFHGSYYARLLRSKIVAEIPYWDASTFWRASPAKRAEVLEALADAGATVAIADWIPIHAERKGWEALGETGRFIRRLR